MNDADPRAQMPYLVRRIGVFLLGLALFLAYGFLTVLLGKVLLRTQGVRVPAVIDRYEESLGRRYAVVSFQSQSGEHHVVRSPDSFLPWTAPPVGTGVEVRYDAEFPRRIQLKVETGVAQYEWLATPAVLAFSFVFLLLVGLRFLLN